MADKKQDSMNTERGNLINRTVNSAKKFIGRYGGPAAIIAGTSLGTSGIAQANKGVEDTQGIQKNTLSIGVIDDNSKYNPVSIGGYDSTENFLRPTNSPEQQVSILNSTNILPEIQLTQSEVMSVNAIARGEIQQLPIATATHNPNTGIMDVTGLFPTENGSELDSFYYGNKDFKFPNTGNVEWQIPGLHSGSDVVRIFGSATVGIVDLGNNNVAPFFQPLGPVELNVIGRDTSTATPLAPQLLALDQRSVLILQENRLITYIKPQENENVVVINPNEEFQQFINTNGYQLSTDGSKLVGTVSKTTGELTNIITTIGSIPVEGASFVPDVYYTFGPYATDNLAPEGSVNSALVAETFSSNRVPESAQAEFLTRLNLSADDPQKISITQHGEIVNAQGWIWRFGMSPDNNIDSGFLETADVVKTQGTNITISLNLNPNDMANRPVSQDRVIDIEAHDSLAEGFKNLQNYMATQFPDLVTRLPNGSEIDVNFVASNDGRSDKQEFVWTYVKNGSMVAYAFAVDTEQMQNGAKKINVRIYCPGGTADAFTPDEIITKELKIALLAATLGVERPGQLISAMSHDQLNDAYVALGAGEANSKLVNVTIANN